MEGEDRCQRGEREEGERLVQGQGEEESGEEWAAFGRQAKGVGQRQEESLSKQQQQLRLQVWVEREEKLRERFGGFAACDEIFLSATQSFGDLFIISFKCSRKFQFGEDIKSLKVFSRFLRLKHPKFFKVLICNYQALLFTV